MYKLAQINKLNNKVETVIHLLNNTFIPFAPGNTDYQNFKAQINADEATLQDADGNTMTAEEAKAYIATLP